MPPQDFSRGPTFGEAMADMVTPFSIGNQLFELKYQYLHRPSVYSRLGTTMGMRWTGLWGFRTIAGGWRSAHKFIGTKPIGSLGAAGLGTQVAEMLINKPIWLATGAIGRMTGVRGIREYSKYVGSGHGVLGALAEMNVPFVSSAAGVGRNIFAGTAGESALKATLNKMKYEVDTDKVLGVVDDVLDNYRWRDIVGRQIGARGGRSGLFRTLMAQRLRSEFAEGFVEDLGAKTGKRAMTTLIRGVNKNIGMKTLIARKVMPGVTSIANWALVYNIMHTVAYAGVRGINQLSKTAMNINMGKPMFGDQLANAFTNQVASTMRSRALNELQNSRIGSRSVIGNEASMYAG